MHRREKAAISAAPLYASMWQANVDALAGEAISAAAMGFSPPFPNIIKPWFRFVLAAIFVSNVATICVISVRNRDAFDNRSLFEVKGERTESHGFELLYAYSIITFEPSGFQLCLSFL